MHYFVSDNSSERLNQLNDLMTELIFHFENFDKDKLLLLKMNLSKWTSNGFIVAASPDAVQLPIDPSQEIILLKALSLIGECLLFRKSKEEAAQLQHYNLAQQFRDRESANLEKLQKLYVTLHTSLPWFHYTDRILYLRLIDHFFLNQFIRKKLDLEG